MTLKPAFGRDRDLVMMASPADWPRWPRLPLKRTDPENGGQVQCGVLLALEEHRCTVWVGNLFKTIDPETTPRIEYIDYEAVADDGWVVD